MTLPADHPHVKQEKIGVLILNLGTPDSTDYWPMRRYLSEFLSDKRVIDYPSWFWQPILQGIVLARRPFKSGAAYKSIWNNEKNESPLKTYTRSITDKLAAAFNNDNLVFEWGMRYGNPSTEAGIKSLVNQGCRKILFFALYPQYSDSTTASAYDKAFEVLQKMKWQPYARTAAAWHDDPDYIKILADSVKTHLKKEKADPDMIVTSFHGVPQRYLKEGDPYHCCCQKTSRMLREKLKWDPEKWITTFQSRFGPEEWLQPYTDETLESLPEKGVKKVAILSPAFACDCLETLEELDEENRENFMHAGGEEYTYIPCLNDSDPHIKFMAKRIKQELGGWI